MSAEMRVSVDKYSVSAPVANLLATFRAIHAGDKAAERESSAHSWRAGYCFLAFVVLVIAGANVSNNGSSAVCFILGAACLIGMIPFLVLARLAGRHDIDDRKVDTVLQFLKIVAADTPKDAPMALEVDFRAYEHGGEKEGYEKQGGFLSFQPTVYTYKFSHAWLMVNGRLADGNAYQLRIVDRVTRKEKPKRKYTKVRESIKGSVQLALRLKPHYGDPAPILAELKKAAPPEPMRLLDARLSGRRLWAELAKPTATRLKTRYSDSAIKADEFVDGHSLLRTLLWAYGAIGRGAQKQGPAA